jgi:hypothetical protein
LTVTLSFAGDQGRVGALGAAEPKGLSETMFVIGLLSMLVPAGFGGWVAWENRDTVVQVHLGNLVWTGHLYAVFVVGALTACWFFLGIAFVRCRVAERRRARAAGGQPVRQESQPPVRLPQRTPARRSAPGRAPAAGAVRRVASPG